MAYNKLNLQELNTVETSVATWREFIESSLQSEYFKKSYEKNKNIKEVASLTIFESYISTTQDDLKKDLLQDERHFKKYTETFLNELVPYRYNTNGYDTRMRTVFFSKIRTLLRECKDKDGSYKNTLRYEFTRALLKFLSSEKYLFDTYMKYKNNISLE